MIRKGPETFGKTVALAVVITLGSAACKTGSTGGETLARAEERAVNKVVANGTGIPYLAGPHVIEQDSESGKPTEICVLNPLAVNYKGKMYGMALRQGAARDLVEVRNEGLIALEGQDEVIRFGADPERTGQTYTISTAGGEVALAIAVKRNQCLATS
ncbi:MAG TPA: hypothetical protein VMY99_00550 [Nevskiaceae bacterium]|nr:hypothetical protein [Nevskiaceae bacterium]